MAPISCPPRGYGCVLGVGRGGIAPENETGDHHADKPGVPVYGHGAHCVVDLEPALDEEMDFIHTHDAKGPDQVRLQRMVEIVADEAVMIPASPPEKVQ